MVVGVGRSTGTLSIQEKPEGNPRERMDQTYIWLWCSLYLIWPQKQPLSPFPVQRGAMPRTVGTFQALAYTCSRMEKFIYSGPGSWGRGTPRTAPQINPPAMALPLPHLVGKEPHVQRPMPAPLRAAFIITSTVHGAWAGDVSRMQRGLLGILSASRCFFSCFSAPILSISF